MTAVTAGMVVRNGIDHIEEALHCLVGQSHKDFQIIVSDNASNDGTSELVERLAGSCPQIRHIRHERDIGVIANFNFVLNQATTPYFMWAAADDLWDQYFVSVLATLLDANPWASIAFPEMSSINDNGTWLATSTLRHNLGKHPTLESLILTKETAGIPNIFYGLGRREAYLKAGGFVEWSPKPFSQDVLVVFAIIAQGGLVLSGRELFSKRLNGRAYCLDGEAEYLEGYRKIIERFLPEQRDVLNAAVDRKVIG